MQDTKEVLEEIFYKLDRELLLSDLEPQNKGDYYLLNCPKCNTKTAFIYKDGIVIQCNRKNNCAYSVSLWDYIQEKKSLSNKETLEELARFAGYSLPQNQAYSEEKFLKAKEKANILETALTFFIQELWLDKEQKVLNYLKNRGYTESDIEIMEVGYYPSYQKTRTYLINKGYSQENISNLFKWMELDTSHREDYCLVIPYRDTMGNLAGFYGRIIGNLKEGEKDKYKPLTDVEKLKDNLFNIHKARKEKRLTIVEGYLDALIATARGIKGVVATGGSTLTKTQFDNLSKHGFKYLVLSLDNDKAGNEGTERSIKLLSHSNLKVFIAELPILFKDPDEFIKQEGAEKYKNIIENAQNSGKWMANHLISKFEVKTDQDKEKLLEAVLDYDSSLPVSKAHEGEDFLKIISEKTNYSLEVLIAESEKIQERKLREAEVIGYRLLLQESSKLLEQDKINELRETLLERPKELVSKSIQVVDIFYTQEKFIYELNNTPEGLQTGYKSIDQHLTFPYGAVSIIMGKSSHGKTTILLNMFLRMVEKYENKTFVFFSYEEEAKFLNAKLLNIMSQDIINQSNNLNQVMNYVKSRNYVSKRHKIENSLQKLNEYVNQNRLGLVYENLEVNNLCSQITRLSSNYDIGGIFIDYIQRIPINSRFQQRQLELQAISNRILETSIDLSIPIILGAQVNKEVRGIPKDKDVRESGDILNNANIVLSIYNPAKEEAGIVPDSYNRVPFKVCLAKSRNTISNNLEIDLKLEGSTLKIFDPLDI